MQVGPLLRFAEAVLALDLDVVETPAQVEARDLAPLDLADAVGHQRHPDAAVAQLVQGLQRPGKEPALLLPVGMEAVAEPVGQVLGQLPGARPAQRFEGLGGDEPPRLHQRPLAPFPVPLGVGPEGAVVRLQHRGHLRGRQRRQFRGHLLGHFVQQGGAVAEREDGLVQVEQDRARQLGHAPIITRAGPRCAGNPPC